MPTSLQIKFENKGRFFLPGKPIVGTVVVKDLLKSSLVINGLKVRLVGDAVTFQTVGAYGELHERHVFVDEEIDLLNGQSKVQVTKDENEFPFRIMIPETCPPTITVNEANRIRYVLFAEIPRTNRFSPSSTAKTLVRVAALRPSDGKRQGVFLRMFGDVPFVANEPVLEYGDGRYLIEPSQVSQGSTPAADETDEPSNTDLKQDEKMEVYQFDYSDDDDSTFQFSNQPVQRAGGTITVVNGGVQRHQRVGVFGREFSNKLLPAKRWGNGATHEHQLVLEAVFPHTGVYTDRPLALKTRLLATGPMPPLVLHMFKVVLIENTFISAKGTSNNERRRHTLLHIKGPIDLTTSSVHEFTTELVNAFPPGLAATFSEETIRRSYALNVHVQYYKGRIEDEEPVSKLHINARHNLSVLGAADLDPVLPSSSSLFSFRSSAPKIRS